MKRVFALPVCCSDHADRETTDFTKGGCAMAKRKTTTSSEVKMRWMKANYKRYQVQLRLDIDKDLIDFIERNKEKIGTTELFRLGL